MKQSSRTAAMFFALFLLRAGFASRIGATPIIQAEAQAGPLFSLTSLPDMTAAIQSGWEAKFSLSLESRDVFDPMGLTSGGGIASMPAFSGRLELDLFALGQSPIQADGSLYRAWRAWA